MRDGHLIAICVCGLRGEAVEQVDLLEQVQAVLGDPPTRRLLHRRQDPRRVLSLEPKLREAR